MTLPCTLQCLQPTQSFRHNNAAKHKVGCLGSIVLVTCWSRCLSVIDFLRACVRVRVRVCVCVCVSKKIHTYIPLSLFLSLLICRGAAQSTETSASLDGLILKGCVRVLYTSEDDTPGSVYTRTDPHAPVLVPKPPPLQASPSCLFLWVHRH